MDSPECGFSSAEARTNERLDKLERGYQEIKASAAMWQWQPIETAPKDGTLIIGGYFDRGSYERGGDIVRVWFQDEFDAFISSCREMTMAPGYTIDGASRKLHYPMIEPVTHWMPLPDPPEAT